VSLFTEIVSLDADYIRDESVRVVILHRKYLGSHVETLDCAYLIGTVITVVFFFMWIRDQKAYSKEVGLFEGPVLPAMHDGRLCR
jgi:uncharacterized membrane protein YobD (UPF0266 family)